MEMELSVNGFNYTAFYKDQEITGIYIPLLKKLTEESRKIKGKYVVFLAAPPGTGKSTLSLMLEKLSKDREGLEEIQALSMDGFHYHNDYLKVNHIVKDGKKIELSKIKGAPETFDLKNLKNHITNIKKDEKVKWPIYDRQLHNPVMDVIEVNSKIILIEGNWLLLDEEHWSSLGNLCNYSIFIDAKEEFLQDRLVSRKQRGGLSKDKALNFYQNSDLLNVRRTLKNKRESNLILEMNSTGEINLKRGEKECL